MRKEYLQVVNEIEKAQRFLSVFIFLKDGKICGRLTARNISKTNTTHVAFTIYPFVNDGVEISAYEKVSGSGFNRQDFGINLRVIQSSE